jgi:hypothetical protein
MSDIFNNYAKIMEEQGLLKNAQRSSEAKTRPQGIDPEAIQMLYHVKPNGKDEKPIVEQAHPEPAYVAPAYDRMNGLVENVQERQNMMIEIMEDPQHGKLTQHRYVKANNELLQELIRVATYMDNKNQEDLMKLADSCASELTKEYELKKKAFLGPAAVAVGRLLLGSLGRKAIVRLMAGGQIAGWGATLAGVLSGVNQGINLSAGLIKDTKHLLEEIDDVLRPDFWEFSSDLTSDDRQMLLDLSKAARDIQSRGYNALKMRRALSKAIKNLSEGEDEKTSSKLVDNEYHESLKKFFEEHKEKLEDYLKNVELDYETLDGMQQAAEGTSGVLTRLWRQVVPTEIEDVEQATERLLKSLTQELDNTQKDLQRLEELASSNSELKTEAEKVKKESPEKDTELDLPEADLDQFIESLNPANETEVQTMPEAAADDESY